MDAELQKLVESGKLTAHAAEQLENLKPGAFCLHKSWGFGRVAEWNLLLNQIVIDFQGKKGHPMQLQYAADNLTVIPAGHFLARKASDLATVKDQLKSDPVGLVRNILEGFGGAATQSQISEMFVGDLFNEGGMETLVGIDQEVAEERRFFPNPGEENRADQVARRKSFTRR